MTNDDHDSLVIPLYAVGFGMLALSQILNFLHTPLCLGTSGSSIQASEEDSRSGTATRSLRAILFFGGWILTIAGAAENHRNLDTSGEDAWYPIIQALFYIPILAAIGSFFGHYTAEDSDRPWGKMLSIGGVVILYMWSYAWAGLWMARGREHTGRALVFSGFIVQMGGEMLIQLHKIFGMKTGNPGECMGFVLWHAIYLAGLCIWFTGVVIYQPHDGYWDDGFQL